MSSLELKSLTDKWLKSFNTVKERLNDMDNVKSKNDVYIEEIQSLKSSLSTIVQAISYLSNEDQKIICYRYFDKLTCKEMSTKLGRNINTIRRRKERALLKIGRLRFGFEDELIYNLGYYIDFV